MAYTEWALAVAKETHLEMYWFELNCDWTLFESLYVVVSTPGKLITTVLFIFVLCFPLSWDVRVRIGEINNFWEIIPRYGLLTSVIRVIYYVEDILPSFAMDVRMNKVLYPPVERLKLSIEEAYLFPYSKEWRLRAFAHAVPSVLLCLVAQSCPTVCNPMDCSPPSSSVLGDSPGKNTRVGCHALLQGIFPT